MSKLENAQQRQQRKERDQLNLYATADLIRTGQHRHNLGVLAQRYFGIFDDLERKIDSISRLKNEIGDDLTELALEGFQAVLWRQDLPSPASIAELSAENRHYTWRYAILAGMDEKWHHIRCLDVLPEAALETALCLAFTLSTFEYNGNTARPTMREWPDRILTERPELARWVFHAFLHPLFKKKALHSGMLDQLVSNENTQYWRGELALELLEEFPSAPLQALRNLLYAVLSQASSWIKLAVLAEKVLRTHGRVRGEQRVLWMVTGYLLSPDDFRDMLLGYTRNREEALWTVKECVESISSYNQGDHIALTIVQRQFLVWLIGRRFGHAYHPIGEMIQGNRHGWDAAEFVRRQIEALSAEPSEEAGEALVALASNKKLLSYRDHLRHAIANHAKIRRQHQYTQPDWDKTVETLRGGQPANIADLYALVSAHLRTLCNEIRQENIDIYKHFWELSQRSGSIQRPLHEEVCRDRLIGLLRPRLFPLGIFTEPEGHMAADKRADMVLYHRGELKLPIEVKRHTHTDLWTACEHQLDRLYARDPHAAGFGIYLVFWFGEDRGGRLPSPPHGMVRPDSATALEQALRSCIPEDKTNCLDVIVLDVTPPAATKKTRTKSRQQK